MDKLWIVLSLALLISGAIAQNDDSAFPDYWDDDYDAQWYNDELEKLGILDEAKEPTGNDPEQNIAQSDTEEDDNNFNDYDNIINQPANVGEQEKNENNMDKKVEEEIKEFRNENDAGGDQDGAFDVNSDYQFEDNRSVPKEEQVINVSSNESADDDSPIAEAIEPVVEPNEPANKSIDDDEVNDSDEQLPKLNEEIKEEVKEDTNDPQLAPEVNDDKEIFDETKNILREEENSSNDFSKGSEQVNNNDELIGDIVEETRKLLEDTNEALDKENADTNNDDLVVQEKQFVENEKQDFDEDTVNKVYSDLNADLNKLFDTWEKLKSEDVDIGDVVKQDGSLDFDYSKEGDGSNEYYINSFEEDIQARQGNDNAVDIDELFKDDPIEKQVEEEDSQSLSNTNVESNEPNPDDTIEEAKSEAQPILYLNDALIAGDENETINSTEKLAENEARKLNVDALSSSELDTLMKQFKVIYSADLDTESKDFDKNIAVVHMELDVDEPLIVTSPNYPNPYPTNNIIDWLFEGEGVGIELNITDFAVNGALGDYLLIKPGGLDASGTEGLIFSYRLDEERRYRFTDVNRMFVRFEAKPGMAFFRGFNFSVKLIAPTLRVEAPLPPEPEFVQPAPNAVHSVYLGGVSLRQFNYMSEEFRQVVADMAEEYIRRNQIDPGHNTTSEVTQITRAGICSINWPDYSHCVEVSFGVPLSYDEEETPRLNSTELSDMWTNLMYEDPFALRLRRMGLSEFSPPNDTTVLMVWLVIGFGVLISVVMLVVALWRFNCFEDYTRMPVYNDTDSIVEKRGLDLYPTPHQTLPALDMDSDHDFDDTTRVDMGGYTNSSFVRDGDFLGSEEAAPPAPAPGNPRERFTTEV